MFGKVFASLYQGTLRGRSREILVFTNMIACADRDGFVDKHPRAIAEETGLSLEDVAAAIEHLEAPDPESRSPAEDGRRIARIDDHRTWGWRIVNHLKYRTMRDEEARRETFRVSQRKRRARLAGVNQLSTAVNQPSTSVNDRNAESCVSTQAEAEADVDAEVDARDEECSENPSPRAGGRGRAGGRARVEDATPRPAGMGDPLDDLASQFRAAWEASKGRAMGLWMRRSSRALAYEWFSRGLPAGQFGPAVDAFLADAHPATNGHDPRRMVASLDRYIDAVVHSSSTAGCTNCGHRRGTHAAGRRCSGDNEQCPCTAYTREAT